MPDPRIVFVTLAPGVWGAERSLVTLASALVEDGATIDLICVDEKVAAAWTDATGLSARLVSTENGPRWRQVSSMWKQISLLTTRTDVVVLFSYVLAPGAIIPRQWPNGRPSIALDLHDTLTPGFGRVALTASALGIRSVIAVSRYTASQFIRVRSQLTVLTRPIAPLPLQRSSRGGRTTIAVLGRVTPEKRCELLIRAAETVHSVDVIVRGEVAVGQEAYARELERRGRSILGDRFRIEGARAWETALHDVDVLVVANDKEPMGRTVLEAQLSGVIAIVPDRGGSSELVDPGRTGFRYTAGSAASLADTIRKALASDLRATAENAREYALQATRADRYAQAYRKALDA